MNADTKQEKETGHAVAVLGGGCFWCLDAVFREVEGVLKVMPGYCGGSVANPGYQAVCEGTTGHAEVIRVEFDPAVLPYRAVLEIFFAMHDPTTLNRQGNDVGTQYRSVIFPVDEAQRVEAAAFIAALGEQKVFPGPIVTQLEPPARFWPAEEVHIDFFAQNPGQPYCQYVVAPKLASFRARFAQRRRPR